MSKRGYYCGPFWMPVYLRKLLSKDFNRACWHHDQDYNTQPDSRIIIDKRFYDEMIVMTNGDKRLERKAKLYYNLVRFYAWTSWYLIKWKNASE